ncbi:MAG: PAS domain-containing protein [Chitinophagaceae bacterium]
MCKTYGSFQDIDRLKRSEVAIIEGLQTQVLTLERIRDGYISWTASWTVRYWNSSAEGLLGRKREEALGKNLWDLYADAVDFVFTSILPRLWKQDLRQTSKHFMGQQTHGMSWTCFPRIRVSAIFFKDITERKNYLQTVERQNGTLKEIAWSTVARSAFSTRPFAGVDPLVEDMRRIGMMNRKSCCKSLPVLHMSWMTLSGK